jgi:hypothetical protein
MDALSDMVRRVIADDLAVEDALDAEVHEMLRQLAGTMRAQNVDYSIMFEKVKKQLVRERKLVL